MLIYLDNIYPIFCISVVGHYHDNINYYFVGLHNKKLKSTFDKIEHKKSVTDDDIMELKEIFYDDTRVDNIIKEYKKVECHFIYDLIKFDDNILTIQNKILTYMHNSSIDFYPINDNQQLWIIDSEGKNLILSDHWVGIDHLVVPDVKKMKYDKKFVDSKFNIKSTLRTNNYQKYILGDMINFSYNSYTLYLSLFQDEYDYYYDKDSTKVDSKKYMNSHFKRFWPKLNTDIDTKEILSKIKEKQRQYDYESYQDSLIFKEYVRIKNNLKKDETMDPNITQIRFALKTDITFDLIQIYDFLRQNLDETYIFIKYNNPTWDIGHNVSSLWKNAIPERKVYMDQLLYDWIKFKDMGMESYKTKNVITLKIFNYQSDNTYHYGNVKFHQNGTIQLDASYKETVGATFKIIEQIIDKFNTLLKKLNTSVMKREKIPLPEFKYIENDTKGRHIMISDNFQINNINSSNNFTAIKRSIEFESLKNFSNFFKNIIIESNDVKKAGILYFKYKKISLYEDVDDVSDKIMKLLEQSYSSEEDIIHAVALKHKMSYSQVQVIMNRLKQKHYMNDIDKAAGNWVHSGVLISYQNGKIQMKFVRTIPSLIMGNMFSRTFLNLYLNREQYYKDPVFKKYLEHTDNIVEIQKYDEDELSVYNENNQNEFDFSNNNGNMNNNDIKNLEKYKINDNDVKLNLNNENIDIFENNSKSSSIANENNIKSRNLKKMSLAERLKLSNKIRKLRGETPISELTREIRPDCDDYIPETDTCADFCNDTSFILRRLMSKDQRLFDLGPNEKYSRKAQPVERHIFVMDNPPDQDPEIKQDSYSYYIKYGSNPEKMHYYLCPAAININKMIPIPLDDVVDVVERVTRARSTKCVTGVDKNNGDEVVVLSNVTVNKNTGIITKQIGTYNYPGFLGNIKNVDGLCIPVCFATDHRKQARFSRCMTGSNNTNNTISTKSIGYILIEKQIPIKDPKRFGLLSAVWSKKLQSNVTTGQIKTTQYGYVRRGITHSNKKQSFVEAMADVASNDKNNPTKPNAFINFLAQYIRDNPDVFRSLNNGDLEAAFRNYGTSIDDTVEKFIKHLKDHSNNIDEYHIMDLCSRPGVIYDEGLNIIVLRNDEIPCPHFLNIEETYNVNKPTVMIINQQRFYYEPIYFISGIADSQEIEYFSLFDSNKPEIKEILDKIISKCDVYYDMDWERKLRDQEKILGHSLYHTIRSNPLSYNDTKSELEKLDRKYAFKSQLVDLSLNKTYAILTENDVIIPITIQGFLTRESYRYVASEKVNSLNYDNMKKELTKIANNTKIPVKPLYKIISDDGAYKGKIIGIYLECGRIVHVIPENNKADNLPQVEEEYQLREYIANNSTSKSSSRISTSKTVDQKSEILISRWNFEKESYQQFRYLLSEIYRNNVEIRNKMDDIINSEESVDDKLKEMMIFIKTIIDQYVYIPASISWMNKFIYKNPSKRLSIISMENPELCNDNPHYKRVNDSCKLIINPLHSITGKINPVNYAIQISQELIRIPFRREEILQHMIPNIITNVLFEPYDNEILFMESDPAILARMIEDLYNDIIQKDHLRNMYSVKSTEYSLSDKSFYEISQTNISISTKFKIDHLSSYLEKELGSELVAIINKNTVFYIMNLISEDIMNEKQTEIWFKESYIKFLNDVTINELFYYLTKLYSEIEAKKIVKNKDREEVIINILRSQSTQFNNVKNFPDVIARINDSNYVGGQLELYYFAHFYNINIVIWDKRKRENQTFVSGFVHNFELPFIFLYKHNQITTSIQKQNPIFLIFDNKNKTFSYDQIPPKAKNYIDELCISLSDRDEELAKNLIG